VTRLTAVRHQHSYSACKPDRPCRRAIIARVSSAAAPTQPLDLQPGSGGSAVRDPADDRVRVTFRWPAALGGQEVYIAGALATHMAVVVYLSHHTFQSPSGNGLDQPRVCFPDQASPMQFDKKWCRRTHVHAGDFNNWQGQVPMQQSTRTGDFVRTVSLPVGTYEVR
jgi:hypothetical protein